MGFMEYELNFTFDWEDNMLLHYCLEEAVGTHGLKPLALRFTDLGDYERELDDYKNLGCSCYAKLADFNYGMLPAEILASYAVKMQMQLFNYIINLNLLLMSKEFTKLYSTILKPATVALKRLAKNGGPVDVTAVDNLQQSYQIDVEECIDEISNHPAVQDLKEYIIKHLILTQQCN